MLCVGRSKYINKTFLNAREDFFFFAIEGSMDFHSPIYWNFPGLHWDGMKMCWWAQIPSTPQAASMCGYWRDDRLYTTWGLPLPSFPALTLAPGLSGSMKYSSSSATITPCCERKEKEKNKTSRERNGRHTAIF